MLQQTTVSTVIPYYQRFIERFPSVSSLANAALDDVLLMWQGLGYYARGRNFHKAAQIISERGQMPNNETEWLALPGIGPYTAAAICAIAYEHPCVAVDGNIKRVLSRYVGLREPEWERDVRVHAQQLLPEGRIGDYTQALMDMAASLCRPRNPLCSQCPVRDRCFAERSGNVSAFPPRSPARLVPNQYADVFWITQKNAVFVQQNAEKGLLGGLYTFPLGPLMDTPWNDLSENILGIVTHRFTHFRLTLRVIHALPTSADFGAGAWYPLESLVNLPFSRLMRKVEMIARETML